MKQVICPRHSDKNLKPVMIYFAKGSLGWQYICAVCSGVRVFNTGKIYKISGQYGFISGRKDGFFFHFSNLAYDFKPYVGLVVSFEVSFLDNGRVQAINVKPVKGGSNAS